MNGNWHYLRGGQQVGPVSRETLEHLVSVGQITAHDLVWTEGMPQWQPAGQVLNVQFPAPTLMYAVPPQLLLQDPYAGFWRRVVAYVIDAILAGLAFGVVIGLPLFVLAPQAAHDDGPVQLLGTIFGWLYGAIFESSGAQATPGKMALGLYVTDLSGHRISFARALGRQVGKILSGLILFIGFIMIAFTQRKQGLHDMMAGCLVMKRRATQVGYEIVPR